MSILLSKMDKMLFSRVVTCFVIGGLGKSLPKAKVSGTPLQIHNVQYSSNPMVAKWEKNRLRWQKAQTNQSRKSNQRKEQEALDQKRKGLTLQKAKADQSKALEGQKRVQMNQVRARRTRIPALTALIPRKEELLGG